MKLTNSVLPLKNMLDCTVFMLPKYKQVAQRIYNECVLNPHIKDALKALRYSIWHGLSIRQRDEVISKSGLPCVGGYYDYNDSHLDALLRKVLPDTYLIKVVA